MIIKKSEGVTPTERLLAKFCENTFLKLWSYPNPHKDDGHELCDLLVVFENNVIIFFDRESRKFDTSKGDLETVWQRWKKKVIDKQINTAKGAERYIRSGRSIFLDAKCEQPFPFDVPTQCKIYKIIVAHGAREACRSASSENVSGSLAIFYGEWTSASEEISSLNAPFWVELNKDDPVHILDSENLQLVFGELDTIFDFTAYLKEKERAIKNYRGLSYCGEEDLLAHYFLNFNEKDKTYRIGIPGRKDNFVHIDEGQWQSFVQIGPYQRRKEENQISYHWDRLMQKTAQNALDGTLLGDKGPLIGKSALHEMAKEPRFHRRLLCQIMIQVIKNFPDIQGMARNVTFMPSFYGDKGYVFLQVKPPHDMDYDKTYRPIRREMLGIACCAAKNKFLRLKKVMGIGMDAYKSTSMVSEDFVLLECEEWSKETAEKYEKANERLRFFKTDNLQAYTGSVKDFPDVEGASKKTGKIGRNAPCPCGSGKKHKNCCLRLV